MRLEALNALQRVLHPLGLTLSRDRGVAAQEVRGRQQMEEAAALHPGPLALQLQLHLEDQEHPVLDLCEFQDTT